MAEESKDKVEIEPITRDPEKVKQQVYKVIEAEKQKQKAKKSEKTELASHKPSEIIKAPLEPESEAPSNMHQFRLMMLGFVLVICGILLWPVATFATGLGIAIAGAVVIAFGALVPI